MTNEELRIKVAEARGWDVYDREEYPEYYPFGKKSDLYGCFNDQKGEVPKYDTSIDACMELVSEMAESTTDPYIEMSLKPMSADPDIIARFEILGPYKDSPLEFGELIALGYGKTLQDAICNAYLEWKEEQ